MDDRDTHNRMDHDGTREAVRAFYDQHPYPPAVDDLDGYRRLWEEEGRRRADFHLHWPGTAYREGLQVLVAGCGTSQAAKHALREPTSRVVGIDVSERSVRHTETLKRKYNLSNLEVYRLPVERVGNLSRQFDKIVCTGVLHHLPAPEEGLCALRAMLQPDGAMDLMVYAPYGRAGVYMLQEYCRRLGIGHTDQEIRVLAVTLAALPPHHPLARLLAESPDFQHKDALADALLHPQDRAYSVPQLFDLIEGCGLRFGRWVRQAPYMPGCGLLAATPHADRLSALPPREQYAAVELFRGTMLRHSLIVHRDDSPGGGRPPRFDDDGWLGYVPIRLPETIRVQERPPPGAVAVLINRAHTDTDLFLPIDEEQGRWFDAIDGRKTAGAILERVMDRRRQPPERIRARRFFEQLWRHDLVVMDASGDNGEPDI